MSVTAPYTEPQYQTAGCRTARKIVGGSWDSFLLPVVPFGGNFCCHKLPYCCDDACGLHITEPMCSVANVYRCKNSIALASLY